MFESHNPDPADANGPGSFPDDIELDDAARNWVHRHSMNSAPPAIRQLAADAAVTSAIGRAYGAD